MILLFLFIYFFVVLIYYYSIILIIQPDFQQNYFSTIYLIRKNSNSYVINRVDTLERTLLDNCNEIAVNRMIE